MHRLTSLAAGLPALRSRFEQLASSWRELLSAGSAQPSQQPVEPSHSLRPLQTEWVDSKPGLQVTCLDGCLLLNYEGQQRDIILVRGESHACDTQGRLAVRAFIATAVLIH